MCGRFALTAAPEEIERLLQVSGIEPFPPRYNIAPTQPLLVATNSSAGDARKALLVRWGLVPSWVKDPNDFTLLINARSETAAEKPSFRTAMRHRRTLIPASGFYEWHRPDDKSQPKQAYWIRPAEGGVICFGGLMETWSDPNGSEIDTGCILTTESNKQIGNIHHRMPVVIKPEAFTRWLDCKTQEPRDVADLLHPVEDGFFEAIPVGDKVNKVANSSPDIQKPVSGSPKSQSDEARTQDKKADDGQFDLF